MATGAGWPAALGAILDLGLFAQHLIDDDRLYGPAVLLGEEGNRMARGAGGPRRRGPHGCQTPIHAELQDVVDRLASSGYPVRADPDFKTMVRQRTEYMTCVAALADHLGKPATPLASTN